LKKAFIEAFNSLIKNKDEILQGYKTIIQDLTDTATLDEESIKLQGECEVVFGLLRKCVEENANLVIDQEDYQKRYNSLAKRYENIKKGLARIDDKRMERIAKRQSIVKFIRILEQGNTILTEFDEELWDATVDMVTIYLEHEGTFTFKDGFELNWNILK
jgi:site-specific DNA recombinase